MIRRTTIVGIGLAAVAAAAALSHVPAAAHHAGIGWCDEFGIWTPSDRARQGLMTKEHMVRARVSYYPQAATCKSGWSTHWWMRNSTNYNAMDIKTDPVDTNRTEHVNYVGYPVDGQYDYINSRTRGQLVPLAQESVNLYVATDDGVKVWFDGQLVIDEWHDHASPTTYHYVTPVLSPTREYPVMIEYYHRTGQQRLQLYWKRGSSTDIVMPASMTLNGYSSQHSSLHAKAGDLCTETVANRMSTGELRIVGYGCNSREDPDNDPPWVSLGSYPKEWVTLFQRWNGADNPTTWSHWVYSEAGSGQWIFVGNTGPRPEEMQGWLESSGYNASVPRQTTFENYREGSQYVDFTVCPVRIDNDEHQAMDPYYVGSGYGAVRFFPASDAEDNCEPN